jgi:hypothetical protein
MRKTIAPSAAQHKRQSCASVLCAGERFLTGPAI